MHLNTASATGSMSRRFPEDAELCRQDVVLNNLLVYTHAGALCVVFCSMFRPGNAALHCNIKAIFQC